MPITVLKRNERAAYNADERERCVHSGKSYETVACCSQCCASIQVTWQGWFLDVLMSALFHMYIFFLFAHGWLQINCKYEDDFFFMHVLTTCNLTLRGRLLHTLYMAENTIVTSELLAITISD